MMMDGPHAKKVFLFCAGLFVCAGLWLAAYGILVPYSYWWDELYSVVAASSSWDFMFNDFILRDVHPPLYQVILKIWISLFSHAEAATRLLSLLFSFSAFSVLFAWGRKRLPKAACMCMLLFFAANRMFIYYAQEARSYAMLLLGSAVLTVLTARITSSKNTGPSLLPLAALAAVLLSLTHYFGLLYAGVVLIYLLFRYMWQKSIKKSIFVAVTGVACTLWPLYHYVYGHIGASVQQGTWIQTQGWQTPVMHASLSLMPHISAAMYKLFLNTGQFVVAAMFCAVLLIIMALASKGSSKRDASTKDPDLHTKSGSALAIILVSYMAVVVICNMISPMSTPRNFIILLPIVSVLFGIAIQNIWIVGRIIACCFVLVLAVLSIVKFVFPFVSPWGRLAAENHKAASRYIAGKVAMKAYNVYYYARQGTLANIQHKMAQYYFAKSHADAGIEAKAVTMRGLPNMAKPFMLFVQHGSKYYADIMHTLTDLGVAYTIYLPHQRSETNVFVVRAD